MRVLCSIELVLPCLEGEGGGIEVVLGSVVEGDGDLGFTCRCEDRLEWY